MMQADFIASMLSEALPLPPAMKPTVGFFTELLARKAAASSSAWSADPGVILCAVNDAATGRADNGAASRKSWLDGCAREKPRRPTG